MPKPKTCRGDYARLRHRTKMIIDIMERHGVKWTQARKMLEMMDRGCRINRNGMVFYNKWDGGMIVNPTSMRFKGFKPRTWPKDKPRRRHRGRYNMIAVDGGNV